MILNMEKDILNYLIKKCIKVYLKMIWFKVMVYSIKKMDKLLLDFGKIINYF